MLWSNSAQNLNPFVEMRRMQGELNRLLNGYAYGEESFPAVDVRVDADKVLVSADIPGVDPKTVNISVKDNVVAIEGEKTGEQLGEGVTFHRRERSTGRFAKSLQLPFAVDADKVSATCKDGVLAITLPRHEASKPKKIQIN